MKIVLSGGGTLGPVVPLLAVREVVLKKYPDAQFVWVGTKNGPEREIVTAANVPFFVIGAGKWRRYFSILNIVDVFRVVIAFFQSLFLIWQEKPDLMISCGGFVSVPLHWAGALLGIPAWVHQQDARVGFANKLMFPFAKKITTALRDTAASLPERKAEWIGNPARDLSLALSSVEERGLGSPPLLSKEGLGVVAEAGAPTTPGSPRRADPSSGRRGDHNDPRQRFGIPPNVPVIFALGGGTGSASINRIVLEAMAQWPKEWHVIHLVGRERPRELMERAAEAFPNYHVYQFFTDEIKDAYAIADVVIARAGFSTLTELASLKKAAIILPMYGTHQEENARLFAEHGGIILIKKSADNGLNLAQIAKDLIDDPERRQRLGNRLHEILPRAKPERIVQIVEGLV